MALRKEARSLGGMSPDRQDTAFQRWGWVSGKDELLLTLGCFPSWTAPSWDGFPGLSCLCPCCPASVAVYPAQSLSPGPFPVPPASLETLRPLVPRPRALCTRPSPPLAPSAGAPPAACNCWARWAEVLFGGVWVQHPLGHKLSGRQSIKKSSSVSPASTPLGIAGGTGRRPLCWATMARAPRPASCQDAHACSQAP